MSHENQLGTQQANAFRALLHRTGDAFALTDIGKHFDRMTVLSDGGFMTAFGGSVQAQLAGVTFLSGALQGLGIRGNMQATALPVDQQRRTGRQQQDAVARSHQRRNTQRSGYNGAVCGRAAAGGQNTGNPCRIKAGDIRGAYLIHYQHIRLVGFGRGFDTAQLRQHTATNIAQIGSPLGQQRILQGLLLERSRFDDRHPRRFRAFALFKATVDFIGQLRVVEHFLMGDEDFANGLGLAALNQPVNVLSHIRQRFLQTLALHHGRFATQRIIQHLQHLNMRRAHCNAGGCRDGLKHAASGGCSQYRGNVCHHRRRFGFSWQRLDFFAEAFFNGGQNGWQGIVSDARLSDELQHLTATGAQAQEFAQTFGGHRRVLAIDNTHADVAVETFGQLRQNFRRARVQAVGIGQGNAGARPVCRQLAAQHFEHCATAGGAAQFMASPFNQ